MPDNITPRGFLIGLDKPDDDAEPNRAIESFFFNYLKGSLKMESFEFRKELVRQVLSLFCTETLLYRWWFHQQHSPYFTESHLEFLRDILRYAKNEPMKYDFEAWDSLIGREEGALFTPPADEQYEIEYTFFGITTDNVHRELVPYRITDLIEDYAKQEGGLGKLLYACYILFGKHYREVAD